MAKIKVTKDQVLFKKAKRYLVGGVDSPVRSFKYVGGDPILLERGSGCKVYDYSGNEYIDYVLSWGAAILGHAHPMIARDLNSKIKSGLSFGTTNKSEVELARVISQAISFVDKVRFVNSGTEAVMGAIRLARAYTKRDKILKFENSYHGHADYLLAKAGSGLATLQIPQSAGIPRGFIKNTLVINGADIDALEKIFKKYGKEIAAVIFEPVGGNYGVNPWDVNYLKYLRAVTKKYKTLLIADEVITGFRFKFGSLCEDLGINPDLICLGKIIGGALPIGGYAGKAGIMNHLAPLGDVYQASTFSGNPIVMQAGLTSLKILQKLKSKYALLKNSVDYLSKVIKQEAGLYDIEVTVNNYGSMFSLKFENKANFSIFYRKLLSEGVYFAPSEYEANFVSFAHTQRDIHRTADAIKKAIGLLKNGR
jgi:glutamate-1-semialdehyde 2,1-aminomutase